MCSSVSMTLSSGRSKTQATAPRIVVLTIGTVLVPNPLAIAMLVASIVATRRPGRTAA